MRTGLKSIVALFFFIAFTATTLSVVYDVGYGGGFASFVAIVLYILGQGFYLFALSENDIIGGIPEFRKDIRRLERQIQDLLLSGEANDLPNPGKPMVKIKKES
jgi:hypothetical protein